MRIIYDTEKPAHERVTIDDSVVVVGCFKLEFETYHSGQTGSATKHSRGMDHGQIFDSESIRRLENAFYIRKTVPPEVEMN